VKVKGQRRNDIELKVLNVRENCTDISMTREIKENVRLQNTVEIYIF